MNNDMKIGITGPISEINFGDYAMMINNIYDIDVKNVTIFTYNKGFSNLIMEEYCKDYNIKIKEVKIKKERNEDAEINNDNSKKVGFLPFKYPTITPLDILLNSANYEELYENIKELDVLIVNGGGYFNHLWNNSLWRWSMIQKIVIPIIIANQQNKKIIFTGNSFGPFDDSEEFYMYLFKYLKNVEFAVRDTMYSRVYLNKIGIEDNKIHNLPDDLYIINDRILNKDIKEKIEIDNYMVLELYYTLDIIKENMDIIEKFSKEIYAKYNLKILFLPFDLDRGGMEQGEYLKSKLLNYYLYDISKIGYLPIQDANKIIHDAKLVLCTRYHAAVLSLENKTPFINIVKPVCNDNRYYFNKTYGLLKNALDGEKFNELNFMRNSLRESLDYILENYEIIIKEQKRLYNSETYKENFDNLKKVRKEYLKNKIIG